jgi:hypothetical protein
VIGIAGANAIHAHQVEAPPAHLIFEAYAINIAGSQKYGEKLPETLAPFKGRYHFLVRCGIKPQALDGGYQMHRVPRRVRSTRSLE